MKKLIKDLSKMTIVIVLLAIALITLVNVYEARVESVSYNNRSIQIGK